MAPTLCAAVIVSVQVGPVFDWHAPVQPLKALPSAVVAVSVTLVPSGKSALHVEPHAMPAGALVKVPSPPPDRPTVNVCVGGGDESCLVDSRGVGTAEGAGLADTSVSGSRSTLPRCGGGTLVLAAAGEGSGVAASAATAVDVVGAGVGSGSSAGDSVGVATSPPLGGGASGGCGSTIGSRVTSAPALTRIVSGSSAATSFAANQAVLEDVTPVRAGAPLASAWSVG